MGCLDFDQAAGLLGIARNEGAEDGLRLDCVEQSLCETAVQGADDGLVGAHGGAVRAVAELEAHNAGFRCGSTRLKAQGGEDCLDALIEWKIELVGDQLAPELAAGSLDFA